MMERGGDVITRVVESRKSIHVIPHIAKHVRPRSRVYSDEAHTWNELRWSDDYDLHTVNHRKKEWARGPVSVNTLEGFWAGVKRMIQGTHVWVSKRYLQNYLCEVEFRANLRTRPDLMMRLLLTAFPPARP